MIATESVVQEKHKDQAIPRDRRLMKWTMAAVAVLLVTIGIAAMTVARSFGKTRTSQQSTRNAEMEPSQQTKERLFWEACDKCYEMVVVARSRIRAHSTLEQISVSLAAADSACQLRPKNPYAYDGKSAIYKQACDVGFNLDMSIATLCQARDVMEEAKRYESRHDWDEAERTQKEADAMVEFTDDAFLGKLYKDGSMMKVKVDK